MTDLLSDEARALIESAAVATLVTLDGDGGPHRRDPRVALTVHGDRVNQWGLREYLVISGTARLTDGGAPELLQRLAHTYLGPDVVFPAMPDPPPGFVIRIGVERVSGVGPWRRG